MVVDLEVPIYITIICTMVSLACLFFMFLYSTRAHARLAQGCTIILQHMRLYRIGFALSTDAPK